MSGSTKILSGVVVALLAGFAFLGWSISQHGFSARAKPTWLETVMARNARRIALPRAAKKLEDPYPVTAETLKEGREHWADHCALCHGLDGTGKTTIGRNVYPPAPDMRSAAVQDETDGELFCIITNGIRFTAMPAWGSSHTAEETWSLVAFVRHLPKLTPEEFEEMQRTTPMEMPEIAPQKPEHGTHHHEHRESR